MNENRRIRKVVKSRPTIEGAGVHLRRAIGFGDAGLFDPFLLLDDFRSDDPGAVPARGSRGTRTAASRRSPTCCAATSSTATAWATAA